MERKRPSQQRSNVVDNHHNTTQHNTTQEARRERSAKSIGNQSPGLMGGEGRIGIFISKRAEWNHVGFGRKYVSEPGEESGVLLSKNVTASAETLE